MSANSLSTPPLKTAIPAPAVRKREFDRWWIMVVIVVALIILLLFVSPDPYQRLLRFVSDGIWRTIYLTIISFILVLIFGLIVGLARLSKTKIIRGIATVYVEVIRGIPMMVQIIYWYFAAPAIIKEIGASLNIAAMANYRANGIVMAIFGLTFGYSAYMSEVYRAGIQSISRGQMEAARSLGMTYFQAMRYVIIPQAVRVILPPVGNEFITLLKDTALVSAVSIAELTRRGREFAATNFNPIETYTMVALVYLTMTLLATRAVTWLEKISKYER
jgi:polar amino acid transport system permease protein